MPGEFERHAGCWMAWPRRPDNWRAGAGPARAAFAEVARAIARTEPVTVAAHPDDVDGARTILGPDVEVVAIPSDDAWMRDIGATIVVDAGGRRRGVDWEFNAWGGERGGLYSSWVDDDAMAAAMCAHLGIDRYRAPFVLEGGAVHSDGEGTLLVTEECLLHPNRNPRMDRSAIERALRDYTGAEVVLWLGLGVVEDETDGHVDNLCCFTAPGEVLLTWTDDRTDPQYERSLDARRRLEGARDARGRHLLVRTVPAPGPLLVTAAEAAGVVPEPGSRPRRAGSRLAGSYVNAYPANGRVVMPALDPATDEEARAVLRAAYPGREVVAVPGREILLGGGGIHCITQPVPGVAR
jgi:agmatine deiminase